MLSLQIHLLSLIFISIGSHTSFRLPPLTTSIVLPYILIIAYTWQLFWIAKTSSVLANFSLAF